MAIDKQSEQNVLQNLNKFIRKTNGLTHQGILAALLFVQREAVKRTPVDEGVLRKSYYKKLLLTNKNHPAGEIGNTAEYAKVQHENLEYKHTVGEAKFLEKAIVLNTRTILDIITQRLKV